MEVRFWIDQSCAIELDWNNKKMSTFLGQIKVFIGYRIHVSIFIKTSHHTTNQHFNPKKKTSKNPNSFQQTQQRKTCPTTTTYVTNDTRRFSVEGKPWFGHDKRPHSFNKTVADRFCWPVFLYMSQLIKRTAEIVHNGRVDKVAIECQPDDKSRTNSTISHDRVEPFYSRCMSDVGAAEVSCFLRRSARVSGSV